MLGRYPYPDGGQLRGKELSWVYDRSSSHSWGITQAIETEAPDAAIFASALGLDVSQARITKTKSLLAVHDARLMPNNILADIVWGEMPYREIWLLIANSSLPYRDVRDEVLGVNQRTQPSKLSPGFAVLFEIGGWTCGYTVDYRMQM